MKRKKRRIKLGRWESVTFANGRKDGATLADGLRALRLLKLMHEFWRRDWERYAETMRP